MDKLLLIGIGGFLGAISRFGVHQLARQFFTHPFPISTLLINVAGCFAIGLLFEFWRDHNLFPSIFLFFAVGFLGSFTTYSAFGLETIQLLRNGQTLWAILNVGANTIIGLTGVICGMWTASFLK